MRVKPSVAKEFTPRKSQTRNCFATTNTGQHKQFCIIQTNLRDSAPRACSVVRPLGMQGQQIQCHRQRATSRKRKGDAACLEGLQVVAQVCDEALPLIRLEGRFTLDGSVKAGQALRCDVGCLWQHVTLDHMTGNWQLTACQALVWAMMGFTSSCLDLSRNTYTRGCINRNSAVSTMQTAAGRAKLRVQSHVPSIATCAQLHKATFTHGSAYRLKL